MARSSTDTAFKRANTIDLFAKIIKTAGFGFSDLKV